MEATANYLWLKILGNTIVHVWKLIISSSNDEPENMKNNPKRSLGPNVVMKTIKICSQPLPLPDGVGVVHASPAAGHLRYVLLLSYFDLTCFSSLFISISSSASIYPACFAPYAMVTACTDNTVRFWRCKVMANKSEESCEYLQWEEWQMISKEGVSLLNIPGRTVHIEAYISHE